METKADYSDGEVKLQTFDRMLEAADYYQTRKLLKLYASRYPRFMYKFGRLQTVEDMNHLRDTIVRSKLLLSSPISFNDPFDMSVKFVFDATVEEKRIRFRKVLKDQRKRF